MYIRLPTKAKKLFFDSSLSSFLVKMYLKNLNENTAINTTKNEMKRFTPANTFLKLIQSKIRYARREPKGYGEKVYIPKTLKG